MQQLIACNTLRNLVYLQMTAVNESIKLLLNVTF